MWNLITYIICFGVGTVVGVVLMCLMQAGKQADKEFEQMQRRNQADECGRNEGTL